MVLLGLQKLTLLDFPEKTACTVFTGGCNLRCPFCHNASLVTGESNDRIDEEEFFAFLQKRRGVLDGVCITGGEPLLQNDIEDFCARIKRLGYAVKLDTNGCFPDKLISLCDKKLIDYVAMDIKNSKQSYEKTVGIPGFDITPVEKSVEFLMRGSVGCEFRTTVVKELHSESDFYKIGDWLLCAKKYFLQQFVDSGDILQRGLSAHTNADMERFCAILKEKIPAAQLRGI